MKCNKVGIRLLVAPIAVALLLGLGGCVQGYGCAYTGWNGPSRFATGFNHAAFPGGRFDHGGSKRGGADHNHFPDMHHDDGGYHSSGGGFARGGGPTRATVSEAAHISSNTGNHAPVEAGADHSGADRK